MQQFSHTDTEGRARMVDVSNKKVRRRTARAKGAIRIAGTTAALIRENQIQKGDVLTVAEIAGVQAAKRAHELIPLCHPLPISKITVEAQLEENAVAVAAEVICDAKTGVEMEALTAVSTALLAVYDMCKAVDKNMVIEEIQLLEKKKEDINE